LKGNKMSEMIVVECDYQDDECAERFEGFSLPTSDRFKQYYLQKKGWLCKDGKHYCPLHRAIEGESK